MTLTGFSFNLLFLISAIKSALFVVILFGFAFPESDDWGSVNYIRGGGGGGGGKLNGGGGGGVVKFDLRWAGGGGGGGGKSESKLSTEEGNKDVLLLGFSEQLV